MGVVFLGGGMVGMKIPGSRLPYGYTELTYIESSGTQYVDTGFVPSNTTRVETVLDITSTASSTLGIFGSRVGSKNNTYAVWQVSSQVRYDYYTANFYSGVSPYGQHTIITDGNTLTVDGAVTTATAGTFSAVYNMTIFAVNSGGEVDTRMVAAKLYSFKVYTSGTLVRDFVPCVSDADGVGLFDLVNNKFYGNAGSDSFVGGPEVA